MQLNQLNIKLGQVLMPAGLGCAERNDAIFRNGSINLTYAKVLHAKKRLEKLNMGLNNLDLQRFVQNWFFWLHQSARLAGMFKSEYMGNRGSMCTGRSRPLSSSTTSASSGTSCANATT